MNTPESLISTEVRARKITYYLTSLDDLKNIKSNSIVSDILMVLTSLCLSCILSIMINKATGIDLGKETIIILNTLLGVLIVCAIIAGVLAGIFYFRAYKTINNIAESGELQSFNKGAEGIDFTKKTDQTKIDPNSELESEEDKEYIKTTEEKAEKKSKEIETVKGKYADDDTRKKDEEILKLKETVNQMNDIIIRQNWEINKINALNTLNILKATYWTSKIQLDVTEELKKKIKDNKLDIVASNQIKGDPHPNVVKKLTIQYTFGGIEFTKIFNEGEKVLIP